MVKHIGLNIETWWHNLGAEMHGSTMPLQTWERDCTRWAADGITHLSIAVYWNKIEGGTRGDYDGSGDRGPYGDRCLTGLKQLCTIAAQHGLRVMIDMHTMFGENAGWWTIPAYVIDPVSGLNEQRAIVRSEDMKQAFLDMWEHMVSYLAGTPGIWCWSLLNEAWIYPRGEGQEEMFADLIQKMANIVRTYDTRPVTMRMLNYDWNWSANLWNDFNEPRFIDPLDFVGLNTSRKLDASTAQQDDWYAITDANLREAVSLSGRKVWLHEIYAKSNDDAIHAQMFRDMKPDFDYWDSEGLLEGIMPWVWDPSIYLERPGHGGPGDPGHGGYNMCYGDMEGTPRPGYYEFLTYRTPTSSLEQLLNLVGGLTPILVVGGAIFLQELKRAGVIPV